MNREVSLRSSASAVNPSGRRKDPVSAEGSARRRFAPRLDEPEQIEAPLELAEQGGPEVGAGEQLIADGRQHIQPLGGLLYLDFPEAPRRLGSLPSGGDLDVVEAEFGDRRAARHHLPDPAPGPKPKEGQELGVPGERGDRIADHSLQPALLAQDLLDLLAVLNDPTVLLSRNLLQRRLQDSRASPVAEAVTPCKETEILRVEVDVLLVSRLDRGESEAGDGGPPSQLLQGVGSADRELDLPLSLRHRGQGYRLHPLGGKDDWAPPPCSGII